MGRRTPVLASAKSRPYETGLNIRWGFSSEQQQQNDKEKEVMYLLERGEDKIYKLMDIKNNDNEQTLLDSNSRTKHLKNMSGKCEK